MKKLVFAFAVLAFAGWTASARADGGCYEGYVETPVQQIVQAPAEQPKSGS